jgi:hypothetical protein
VDVRATVFQSCEPPKGLGAALRERLTAAHADSPFSPLDIRSAVRRAAAVAADLGCSVTTYRGGLDLRGVEVDHLWLAAVPGPEDVNDPIAPFVLDPAFPVFDDRFLTALRRFVAGDGSSEELAEAAAGCCLDDRVLGVIPFPRRYRGRPVWSQR